MDTYDYMLEREYEMETELKRRFKEYYFLKTLDAIELRLIRLPVSDPQTYKSK